jgi:hypothetical protein
MPVSEELEVVAPSHEGRGRGAACDAALYAAVAAAAAREAVAPRPRLGQPPADAFGAAVWFGYRLVVSRAGFALTPYLGGCRLQGGSSGWMSAGALGWGNVHVYVRVGVCYRRV